MLFEAGHVIEMFTRIALAHPTVHLTFRSGGKVLHDLPSVTVPSAELEAGIPTFRLFVLAGLAVSNAEARRLIRGGGAKVNDAAVTEEGHLIAADQLRDGAIKLSAGRKHHRLVKPG